MARSLGTRFGPLAVESLEDRATPALFIVTNPSDTGPGTLRHQVAAANALPGPDLIRFQLPVTTPGPTTITLTTGEIAITDSLTILGTALNSTTPTPLPPGNAGPMINISGNQSSRIFNINGPGVLSVSLQGLGLKNGMSTASGGAILNVGENLSLHGCVLTGNLAAGNGGAIETIGTASSTTNTGGPNLNLNYCRLVGNHATEGGAVHFTGPGGMNAHFSTFDGNSSAQEGGAVSFATGGRFSFDSSTVSNNAAGTSGGGLHYVGGPNLAPPGPVTNLQQMLVRNSTFSGNDAKVAGGAVALASFTTGALVVANSTVTHNAAGTNSPVLTSAGGGIHVAATSNTAVGFVSLVSSVLSGNQAIIGSDAFTPGKLSAAFSAVGNPAGIATFVNGGNNLPFGADLKLGALGNNGGPTQTHMPAFNSPLVNHGSNPFGLRFDQRGTPFLRVQGFHADIGAVERTASIAPPPGPNPFSGGEDSDPTDVSLL